MLRLLGTLFAHYLHFVWSTSKRSVIDAVRESQESPRIVATWHGQHLLCPFVRETQERFSVLVANGPFGTMYTETFRLLGLQVIRGSSGTNFVKTGAVKGFRQMLRSLQDGNSIALTVEVPGVGRVVGEGVITLARLSGRPIVPVAVSTRARVTFRWRWDRPTINLPFSRLGIVIGRPIYVSASKDHGYLQTKRMEVQHALEILTTKADAIAAGG